MTVCLIVVVTVYWRIYIVLKRHKNQIQSLQIPEVQRGVQNGDLSSFSKVRKSAYGTFYVYIVFLICLLPSYVLSFLLLSRPLNLISFYEAWLYTTTLFFLNSSLNPVIYCWKMGLLVNFISYFTLVFAFICLYIYKHHLRTMYHYSEKPFWDDLSMSVYIC